MTFNEFNRRLEHCHLDEGTKYLLSHIFEVQIETSKSLDLSLSLMESLADKLQKVALINGSLFQQVKDLQRHGIDGVSVRSEPYEED
jgi:hypothetical protein